MLQKFLTQPQKRVEYQAGTSQLVKRKRRSPPITVGSKEMYAIIKFAFNAQVKPVKIHHAIETRDDMYTETSEDFRRSVKIIDIHRVERLTYILPVDQPLKVVVRGVRVQFEHKNMAEKLEVMDVQSVRCMHRNKEMPYAMVMITMEKSDEGNKLFEIDKLFGLDVRTETKRH